MGIFSRLGEIINANLSTMLEKAENPEKMVRLMIHEMEDTLTEIKSSAAEVIADRIRSQRQLKSLSQEEQDWCEKAELAVSKGRDDLARVALERKLVYAAQVGEVKRALGELDEMVAQYHQDIARLEEKLKSAYRRKKELALKTRRAESSRKVEERIYKANRTAFDKFEEFASRIDRMEAEQELFKAEPDLESQFRELAEDTDVENELAQLKRKSKIKK